MIIKNRYKKDLLIYVFICTAILVTSQFSLLEFLIYDSSYVSKITRDILIVGMFLYLFSKKRNMRILLSNKAHIYILSIFILIVLGLLMSGINTVTLIAARQNSLFLLLFLIGSSLRLNKQELRTAFNILFYIFFIFSFIFLLIWIFAGDAQYLYFITPEYRSIGYSGDAKLVYLDLISSKADDGIYGYYRNWGGSEIPRYYGMFISPLATSAACLFFMIVGTSKFQIISSFFFMLLTLTRSTILFGLLVLMRWLRFSWFLIAVFVIICILFLLLFSSFFNNIIFDPSTSRHIEVYTLLFLDFPSNISLLPDLGTASIATRVEDYGTDYGESVYISIIKNLGFISIFPFLGLFFILFKEFRSSENEIAIMLLIFILSYGIVSESIIGISGFGLIWIYLGTSFSFKKG